jgi:hypothetical protein
MSKILSKGFKISATTDPNNLKLIFLALARIHLVVKIHQLRRELIHGMVQCDTMQSNDD